jgi:CcmD family protein
MNGILFLKAAYVIAWAVYLGYLFRMLVRMRSVEKELHEVEAAGSPSSVTVTAGAQRQRA